MSDTDAEKTLLSAAKTFLDANGFEGAIDWENMDFDPEGKPQWASVYFVPNQPSVVTLGAQGNDRQTGFLQIDLNVPQGGGTGLMRPWLNAARAEFVAGKSFSLGGDIYVSGAGENIVNGGYDDKNSLINGKPSYSLGDIDIHFSLYPPRWGLDRNGHYYSAAGDVPTPDLATDWVVGQNGSLPIPTVSSKPPTVVITSAGWSQGRNVDNWYRRSLTVAFRTDLQRASI